MQITEAMVAKAAEAAYLRNRAGNKPWDDLSPEHKSEWREKVRPVITAALAEMWRTDFENAAFMEPVALALRGRKLPIAVFRYNAESPWRYLESGREVEDDLIATHFMSLPAPPKTGGE